VGLVLGNSILKSITMLNERGSIGRAHEAVSFDVGWIKPMPKLGTMSVRRKRACRENRKLVAQVAVPFP
jgi:hypothetical protein